MKLRFAAIVVPLLSLLLVLTLPAAAAELAPLSDSSDGVTITVAPAPLTEAAGNWEFQISLDTHSGALGDDLLSSSRLLDSQGGEHAPLAWDGDAAGGHHRKGMLRFAPLKPMPSELRLRLHRAGEPKPRLFVWQLNGT